MNPTTTTAIKWGFLIGLANLVWLYVAYWLGLHTSGIVIFLLAFMLGWLAVTVTGFILALRAVRRASASWSYRRGLFAGAIAAAVTALVAVVMQIGYFTIVHPAWPEYLAQQTHELLTSQELAEAEVERRVEEARPSFTLRSYAVNSSVTALVAGVVLSAIIMIFLRRPHPSAAGART